MDEQWSTVSSKRHSLCRSIDKYVKNCRLILFKPQVESYRHSSSAGVYYLEYICEGSDTMNVL